MKNKICFTNYYEDRHNWQIYLLPWIRIEKWDCSIGFANEEDDVFSIAIGWLFWDIVFIRGEE